MGSVHLRRQNKSQPAMRVLLLVALAIATVVAEPEAEANADAWYGYYGYPGYGYYGYPNYHYGHYLGKRSADSKPESEPDTEVNFQLGNYGYRYVLEQTPIGQTPIHGSKFTTFPAVPHILSKREATPAPAPEAEAAYYYNGFYGYPYRYYGGYNRYPHWG